MRMRRLIVGLLTAIAIANGEVLYTDGSHDIDTCLIKGQVGSIDFPCYITDIYYPDSIQADIKKTAPKSVAVVLTDETGTLTAVCRNRSYTLVFRASDKCDNHKVVVDKRIVNKEDIKGAAFDKEALLNEARTLMKGMVKGKVARGYDVRPIKKETVVNGDDYLRMNFNKVYVGHSLIGFIGRIKNYSRYIDKTIDVSKLMKKGYVLFYINGMESSKVVLQPEEERLLYIVTLRDKTKIPYME